jgi:hypothetical protein
MSWEWTCVHVYAPFVFGLPGLEFVWVVLESHPLLFMQRAAAARLLLAPAAGLSGTPTVRALLLLFAHACLQMWTAMETWTRCV